MQAEISTELRTIATSLERKCDQLRREHPIEASMLSAAFQRMIECIRLFDSDEMGLEERTSRIEPLSREIEELKSWLLGPKGKAISDEVQQWMDSWTASYVRAGGKDVVHFVQQMRDACTRKAKGRPVEVRRAAVRGLEMKLARPALSWGEVAGKVWPLAETSRLPDSASDKK